MLVLSSPPGSTTEIQIAIHPLSIDGAIVILVLDIVLHCAEKMMSLKSAINKYSGYKTKFLKFLPWKGQKTFYLC